LKACQTFFVEMPTNGKTPRIGFKKRFDCDMDRSPIDTQTRLDMRLEKKCSFVLCSVYLEKKRDK
jgi:hypothetical protein